MIKIKSIQKQFWEMVNGAKSVVICGHIGPDDDSIASVLAVYWLINKKFPNKNLRMVCLGEATNKWKYFEGFEKLEFVDEINEPMDLLIMLDGCRFERFSKRADNLKLLAGKTICIDHHNDRANRFDLMYMSDKLSSTVEGVYRLLIQDKKRIPKRLGEILLLGILGDTGNLTYLNMETVKVLQIVQKLVSESNINIQTLQTKYQRYPKRILKMVGEMINNTRYFEKEKNWPAFQASLVSRNFIVQHKLNDGEISMASHLYLTNYLRFIKGYDWGFSITPRSDGTCSISFRSLPGVVNVRKLANNFNGGGHELASGCEIKTNTPEKALKIIYSFLSRPGVEDL